MFVSSSSDLEAEEQEDRRQSVRRALAAGALVWSLCFGLDLFVVSVAKSEGGVAWFAPTASGYFAWNLFLIVATTSTAARYGSATAFALPLQLALGAPAAG